MTAKLKKLIENDDSGQKRVIYELPDCTIKHVTDRGGVLVTYDYNFLGKIETMEEWFPITQLYNPVEDIKPGATIDLLISAWIAREKRFV